MHSIQALIIPEVANALAREELSHTRPVAIGHGLSLVPITDAAFEALRVRLPGLGDSAYPEFESLSAPVAWVGQHLSHHGPVAYIETDYSGGTGAQAAVVWASGNLLMPPTLAETGPINAALGLLGVQVDASCDEFDAVGLGVHRRTADWLDDGAANK
jgi:hypothetical protein